MGNLGAQKEKRNDTPISAKKDIMGDKTVRVRADLHHIIKIETAKNGGNVKEVMEIRLRSKLNQKDFRFFNCIVSLCVKSITDWILKRANLAVVTAMTESNVLSL